MTDCGLAIFVKTPALSPVKTRLWPGIGRARAEVLYRLAAAAVASVARQAEGVQPYWAVAEADALHSDAWADFPHLAQGEGGLGERMARVYRLLRQRHRAALLIGADSPQLAAQSLARAAAWLQESADRLALGRAEDGGFWLFGGNRPLADAAWTRVRYSAPDTAASFARAMHGQGDWLELERLCDIDTAGDIPRAAAALAALPAPTAAQTRLLGWLTEQALAESCA